MLLLDAPACTCYWVMVRVSQNCYLVQSGTCFTNSALCLTACWPELSASRAPPSEEIVNALFQRLVVCGALVQLKLLNVHVLMCHPSGYMPLLHPSDHTPPSYLHPSHHTPPPLPHTSAPPTIPLQPFKRSTMPASTHHSTRSLTCNVAVFSSEPSAQSGKRLASQQK